MGDSYTSCCTFSHAVPSQNGKQSVRAQVMHVLLWGGIEFPHENGVGKAVRLRYVHGWL